MKPFSVSAIAKPEHANSTLLAESPGYYANSSDRLKVLNTVISVEQVSNSTKISKQAIKKSAWKTHLDCSLSCRHTISNSFHTIK